MNMYLDALPQNSTLSGGKYVIQAVKGQGGFGITYIAAFPSLKRIVAIKECFLSKYCKRSGNDVQVIAPQHESIYAKYRSEFLSEAQKIAESEHPNIVRIHDYFTENNTAYYVMEYINSVTLADLVNSNDSLTEADSIHYMRQIAEALQVVHQKGIIHRDIKPNNILIKDNSLAFLIDFGAARDIINLDAEHTVILTDGFAPPEQYVKDGAKGYFVDVYGLGATLYYSLTGKIPLSAHQRLTTKLIEPIEINSMISPSVNDIVMKSLSLNPEERYEGMSAFLYDIATAGNSSESRITLTSSQTDALNIFKEFIKDEETEVLVLTGSTHTGKSHLIKPFVSELLKENRSSRVLTIGSRLAEAIRNKNKIDSISSIYSLLYDFSTEKEPSQVANSLADPEADPGKESYKIKGNNDPENTVYIVDEAHLLSDLYMDNELLIFGSGKLLNDLMSFIAAKDNPQRKTIFVGDHCQLLRGNEDESALSIEHLKATYQMKSKQYEMKEIIPFDKSLIITNALQIHQQINKGSFNHFNLTDDAKNASRVTIEDFKEHYKSLGSNVEPICINYSKSQVRSTNEAVRDAIGFKRVIEIGDRVLTYNRFITLQNNSEHSVYNGEFGRVTSVNPVPTTVVQQIKKGVEITLVFWDVEISFPRIAVVAKTRILQNFLLSESNQLSKEERSALYAWSYKQKKKEEPSSLLKMSELYREEYMTIALVKYAYAITCHKAQGYSWKNVYIDFESEQGKANKAYFSWCYTALTCAEDRAFLINCPSISPFYNCEWKENINAIDANFTHSPHEKIVEISAEQEIASLNYNFPADKPELKKFWISVVSKLSPNDIKLTQIEHKLYQEIYHFSGSSGQKGRIVFHYNGKNVFTRSVAQPQNSFTQSILDILQQKDTSSETFEMQTPDYFYKDFLKELFLDLQRHLSSDEVTIYSLSSSKYQEKYTFYTGGEFVECSFYYNEGGFFTSIYPMKASSQKALEKVKQVLISKFIQK